MRGALLEVAEPGAGTRLTCSKAQAVGCRVRGPGACALPRAVAHHLPCCTAPPPGSPHLVCVIEEAPPQLQQGQSHEHRGSLGPPGEGQQQGLVGVLQTAQAVQGISCQEA